MLLLGKRVTEVGPQEIRRLVENAIPESKTLDFKRELKLDTDGEKREFLSDLAAMANTDGGILVVGIDEKKVVGSGASNLAGEVVGIHVDNIEHFKQRIETLVYSSIEPRVNGLYLKTIDIDDMRVLLVAVERFLHLPHMVTHTGSNRFFRRNTASRYPMDVFELGQAFSQAEVFADQARRFRMERIEEVTTRQFHPNVNVEHPCFIHILPYGRMKQTLIDLSGGRVEELVMRRVKPIMFSSSSKLYNSDGLMVYGVPSGKQEMHSYVQLFRSGAMEYYTTQLHDLGDKPTEFSGKYFERIVLECVTQGLGLLKELSVEPPYVVLLSVLGTKGVSVVADRSYWAESQIHKDRLLVPEVLIENGQVEAEKVLKGAFDLLWQASGWSGSPSYNPDGSRRPDR